MAIGKAIKVSGGSSSVEGYPAINYSFQEVGESVQDVTLETPSGFGVKSKAVGFSPADLQHVIMLATVNMTVHTNNENQTAAGDSFDLVAGRPWIWNRGDGYYACPFTVDVTALYATSEAAGTLKCRFLT